MKPNRFDQTVVIPVKWADGKLQYFHGGAMPKLREGTIGDLVVDRVAVDDEAFLRQVQAASESQLLLEEGAAVYAAVSTSDIPKPLTRYAIPGGSLTKGGISLVTATQFPDARFVEIVLLEPLELQLRGTKFGRLKPATCRITSLDQQARSLNHAYALISAAFEPRRISHTGNVFDKILVFWEGRKEWVPLSVRRDLLESNNEAALASRSARIEPGGAAVDPR